MPIAPKKKCHSTWTMIARMHSTTLRIFWLLLPLSKHQIGTYLLNWCVMLVTILWELFLAKEWAKFHMLYTMLQELWMMLNSTTLPRKRLLPIIFALDKFRSYLIGTKIIVYTDNATLRYLLPKKTPSQDCLVMCYRYTQNLDFKVHTS